MTKSPQLRPPADWPKRADDDYDRVRVLGAGAFGEVWLVKSKRADENGKHEYAAIKGVGIHNEEEGATAAREMAILKELNHPNIVELLHDYEPASPEASGRYMALSYVQGPDIGQLLEERGALGLPLAQLIARDLISAVAYMHVRGVMHRDLKPDNIMLAGCKEGKQWKDDDVMWEDSKIKHGRFKAILVDFGFARATSADEYGQRPSNSRKSRHIFKAKSAIGTRHFAAPEIAGTVRQKESEEKALTSFVSSYALISDAYAVGATLSEICTGVPPGQDEESYIAKYRKEPPKKRKPLSKLAKMKKKLLPRPASNLPHDIQLRLMDELPEPAMELITSLMIESPDLRLSVREAQNHEWIGGYDSLPHGDVPSRPDDPMVFVQEKSALL